MQTKGSLNTILLLAVAGLLLWNGVGDRPVVIAAPSQEGQTAVGSISVGGSSAIRVQPNRVVVLFGIQTFAPTPGEARAQNGRHSQAVVEAIGEQGIAERDIATADFDIQPRYTDYDRNIISGYAACNTIAVTLRDVQRLQPVLVAALESGATTVDGIEFSTTNLRALRDQAREQAAQAALEKAEALASAAGMELGRVTNISENSWGSYFGSWRGNRQWTNYQNVVQDLSTEGAIVLEDGTISLGQIVVTAEVSLTAELMEE
jgi:uncharacterized protein YggE